MKSILKSLLAVGLVFSLIIPISASSLPNSDAIMKTKENQIFLAKIDATKSTKDITIKNIKYINDFSDNKYTVVECDPIGYYIYHNESGVFVEYSAESTSPYLNFSTNLYYGGPTEYYQEREDVFYHTITDESIKTSAWPSLAKVSDSIADQLIEQSDKGVLDYVQGTTKENTAESVIVTYSTTYCTSYTYIQNIGSNFGYLTEGGEGLCGYVAGNMMLYYWHKRFPSKNLLPSNYLLSGGTGLNGSLLTSKLRQIGSDQGVGTGTVGWQMRDILISYSTERNVSATAAYYLGAINAVACIQDKKPVILFGSLTPPEGGSNISHAVIAYGVTGDNQFIAHFGWAGYPSVTISGVFGSSTQYVLN